AGGGILLGVMLLLGRELSPHERVFLFRAPRHLRQFGLARAAVDRNQKFFVRGFNLPQSDFSSDVHGCFLRKRWKPASYVVLWASLAIAVMKRSKLPSFPCWK